jgi:asparagine synthase (glutamine-hydrolysing)
MNGSIEGPGDRLTVFGQLIRPQAELLTTFRNAATIADLVPLLRLDDNYVAVYEAGEQVWIVNAFYSLNAYFYSLANGRFLHGDSIHALAQRGPVDLSWNYQAIGDLFALSHLVADDTLARGVKPVPQGSILHWDGAHLDLQRFRHQEFAAPVAPPEAPDRLIELFLDGLRAGAGACPIATSSAGLDSRVNLAGLLHLGFRPELCVMGDPASKDVVVVKQMARAFDLRVNHVLLEPRDYVDAAAEVGRVTNGVKPMDHWHTYVLAKKSGYRREDRVVTGNNGEHVRAVGFDYGVLSRAVDEVSRYDRGLVTGPLLAKYWQMKTHLILRSSELRRCPPEFARYYGTKQQNEKFMSVMPADQTFVWKNDAFVLEQRRRGFQACGLKLMSLGFSPFSAYMRKSWIDAGWRLDLSFRLGSRWHRHAVERLCPALIAFPEEKQADRMLRRQRPLAWAPVIKRVYRTPKVVPYMDYGALLSSKEVVGLLADHASELDDFLPRAVVNDIVDEQLRDGSRVKLVATLTGMALWRASMRTVHAAPTVAAAPGAAVKAATARQPAGAPPAA